MPRVRYTDDGGRYRVAGESFGPGDEAEVSEGLATHLVEDVDRFERVDTSSAETDSGAGAQTEASDGSDAGSDAESASGFDPSAHTVTEIREHVEQVDGNDVVDELEALRQQELEGKNRTTALDAIDDRLYELEER